MRGLQRLSAEKLTPLYSGNSRAAWHAQICRLERHALVDDTSIDPFRVRGKGGQERRRKRGRRRLATVTGQRIMPHGAARFAIDISADSTFTKRRQTSAAMKTIRLMLAALVIMGTVVPASGVSHHPFRRNRTQPLPWHPACHAVKQKVMVRVMLGHSQSARATGGRTSLPGFVLRAVWLT